MQRQWKRCNQWWNGWWPLWRSKHKSQAHTIRVHKPVQPEEVVPNQKVVGNSNTREAAIGVVAWITTGKDAVLSCRETDSSLCQRVGNRGKRNNLLRIRFSRWPAHSANDGAGKCSTGGGGGRQLWWVGRHRFNGYDHRRVVLEDQVASVPLRPLQDLIRVEGANGLEVKYLSYVEVSLRMQHSIAGPEQMHRAPVLVVVDTQYNAKVPLMVGTNIIRCCYKWGVDHSGPKFWMNRQVQPAWRMAFDSFRASTASPKGPVGDQFSSPTGSRGSGPTGRTDSS